MGNRILILALLTMLFASPLKAINGDEALKSYSPDGIPRKIAVTPWTADKLGNHRAVVSVSKAKKHAARVILKWRRPDLRPETKRIVIIDSATEDEIKNMKVLSLTSEEGDILFEPKTLPGKYYIYYLPYNYRT